MQLYLLFVCTVFLNVNAQGPITATGFIGQKEIVMAWDEGESSSTNTINTEVAKLIIGYEGQPDISKRYEFSSKKSNVDGSYDSRQVDIAAGDFNGDGKSEYIVASRAATKQIRLRIPYLSSSTLTYTNSETVIVAANAQSYSNIRVLAGNLDADVADEIILAYVDADFALNIAYYDTDGTLIPVFKTSIKDELVLTKNYLNDWGISLNDLDGDNKAEVIIGFRPKTPGNGVYSKVYKLINGSFVAKARKLIDGAPLTSSSNILSISVASGDFDLDGIQDVALAWGRIDSCGGTGCFDTFIYPIKIGDNISTPTVDSLEMFSFVYSNRAAISLSPNSYSPMTIQIGDLNADGKDEIVLCGSQGAVVYGADANLKLSKKTQIGNYYDVELGYGVNFMQVSDVDGIAGDEVVILDHYIDQEPNSIQKFTLSVIHFDSNLAGTIIAKKTNIEQVSNGGGNSARRHYAVAVGDFNGDNFKIGEGKKYIKTNIIQPLVILNAPPTHFDVLGNTTYDINTCYNANLAKCGHKATYYKSNSETQMVNTEISSDWGVSSTISGGGSYLGIGVKAHLTAKYGEKFSKTQNSTSTVRVSTQIVASGDDLLYATVCDYEIWEYPIYTANNIKSGYVIAVVPKLTENRWFPSKERSADGYVPKHEVGNVLSYTPYPSLSNPDQAQMLRGSYLNGSTDLNESTDATFEVNIGNTFSTEEVKQRDIGMEVGASVSGWGFELSGTATYNQSEISTHKTTVSSDLNIGVHFGPIDRSLGEDNFNVTPYVYWAKNGALVVDYAARAILPSAGGTATWWSDNYGNKQDPAFILPWRLDPEKGLALQDQERRKQTKSISFSPREPSPNDTVTITAIVNNFSLKETDDSVSVSFYLGSPDSGGTLLLSTDNKTIFKTAGKIGAQDFKAATMKWKVPQNIPAFPRIYAVIDPQGNLSEVHENNNVGWTVMGRSGFTTGNDNGVLQTGFDNGKITKAYPNPFINNITIEYLVLSPAKVLIEVYDLQGRIVETLVNGNQSTGSHSVELNGQNLRSGIYFYRYSSGNITEINKFIKE
jgi:hypothetical protein